MVLRDLESERSDRGSPGIHSCEGVVHRRPPELVLERAIGSS
jgi:hypothetical protein